MALSIITLPPPSGCHPFQFLHPPHPNASSSLDISLFFFTFVSSLSPRPIYPHQQALRVKTGFSLCHFPVTNAQARPGPGRSTGCRSSWSLLMSMSMSMFKVDVVVCDPFGRFLSLSLSHHPITSCPWTIPSVPPSAEGDPVNDEATACHRTNRGLMSYPPSKQTKNMESEEGFGKV